MHKWNEVTLKNEGKKRSKQEKKAGQAAKSKLGPIRPADPKSFSEAKIGAQLDHGTLAGQHLEQLLDQLPKETLGLSKKFWGSRILDSPALKVLRDFGAASMAADIGLLIFRLSDSPR